MSFERAVLQNFDIYQTVGYNGKGVVLFTGYYSPEFKASRFKAPGFEHPIYRRPADLVTDPITGVPQGRKMPDGTVTTYPTRAERSSRLACSRATSWRGSRTTSTRTSCRSTAPASFG
jgi:hypothetical protein